MGVVMIDVLQQDGFELTSVKDHHPVETLSTDGADEALGEGVSPRARTGARMIWIRSEPKTSSKPDVNLASRSRTRNLMG
jgi:hypothetical protein